MKWALLLHLWSYFVCSWWESKEADVDEGYQDVWSSVFKGDLGLVFTERS